jgi:integrase
MTAALTVPAEDLAPAALDHRLAAYTEMSRGAYSANTLRAIRSDTSIFAKWCAETGDTYGPPASSETVAAFVDAMGENRKPATVARYIASIDHLHRALDLPAPGASNAVRLALRRLRRSKGTRQDQAKALRWTTIQKALDRMGDDLIDLRDAALLCLAYDTFARASELVAVNVGDVQQDVDGATCYIAKSKTDQEAEGDCRFIASSTYTRIMAWVDAAHLDKSDPLFIPLGFAAKNDRIGTRDVSEIFRRRCGDRFSAHSTRVGAAQDAKAAGASTGAIQQAGGWKSERMVSRYTEKLAARESAAAMLAQVQGR